HLWAGKTVAIDMTTHQVLETWPNGCRGSRGIALDGERGWLYTGCAEGAATTADVNRHGALVGRGTTGAGLDVIDYSPRLAHLYVPGPRSATLTIPAVAPS